MSRAGPRPGLRKDTNHGEIATGLASCGIDVLDTADYGLPFDLLAYVRGAGRLYAVEVKAPGKRHELTDSERELAGRWPLAYIVVEGLDEAVTVLRGMALGEGAA